MNVKLRLILFGAAIAILSPVSKAQTGLTPAPGHWPQWHGPNRDNVSTETSLLKQWPDGGPPLLWKATGLGKGVMSLAVAGGQEPRRTGFCKTCERRWCAGRRLST
ncbi:MAG TPA: hypothetical protein VMY06_03390 [Sedimentisphaerales bacterium]|nr:hypothetical protein [Sedimentisphaerales bacterium]